MSPNFTFRADRREHDVAADADALRALHVPGDPLLLANIWDPATAQVAESAGLSAIATASAALAPVNGFEDHGRLPADMAMSALRRIAQAVCVPVTADMEDGYGLSAGRLVEQLLAAGVCGLNLEDTDHDAKSMVDPGRQADRIAEIKAAGRARGVDLVVNARIDMLLHGQTPESGLARAQQYFLAGADCVYPIFLSDPAVVRDFVALGRTNLLWRPGGPLPRDLAGAGVARISVGPLFFQLMLTRLRSAIDSFRRLDDENLFA